MLSCRLILIIGFNFIWSELGGEVVAGGGGSGDGEGGGGGGGVGAGGGGGCGGGIRGGEGGGLYPKTVSKFISDCAAAKISSIFIIDT